MWCGSPKKQSVGVYFGQLYCICILSAELTKKRTLSVNYLIKKVFFAYYIIS